MVKEEQSESGCGWGREKERERERRGRRRRKKKLPFSIKKKNSPSSHRVDLGASLKNPPPSACFRISDSILSTIGFAALNCCLIPPGQSSRSVAPTRGRESVTSRRSDDDWPLPLSLHAATQAAAAWSAWSPGPIGRRMETGLFAGRSEAEEGEEEEGEVEATTTEGSVVASTLV